MADPWRIISDKHDRLLSAEIRIFSLKFLYEKIAEIVQTFEKLLLNNLMIDLSQINILIIFKLQTSKKKQKTKYHNLLNHINY